MTQLLLTGGTGYIGRAFLERKAGLFSKIIIPTRSAGHSPNTHIDFIKTDGSIESLVQLTKKMRPDIIINCAAAGINPSDRNPDALFTINSLLPAELFKTSREIPGTRFVHIGSMAEYFAPEESVPLMETAPLGSLSAYGASKAAASLMLSVLSNEADASVTTLRLFGVYGPNEAPHRLTTQILSKLGAGESVKLSAGTQQRDFVYIDDVVDAMACAAMSALPDGHNVINIGSGRATSVKDFVSKVVEIGGFNADLLDFGALPIRDTDTAYLVADITKAKDLLSWEPKWHLEKALLDLLN